MQINSLKLLSLVNDYRIQLISRGLSIDDHWSSIHSWTCGRLYRELVNPNYNSFWTLEDPEDVERTLITVLDKSKIYTSSINQIVDSFIFAWSDVDRHATSKPYSFHFWTQFISRAQGNYHSAYEPSTNSSNPSYC